MRLDLVSLAVLLSLGLAACGSQDQASPAASSGVSRVSFLPEEDAYPDAAFGGTLNGDVLTGCLWVETGPLEGDRGAFRLHEDTAELDVSAEPPVIRDGTRVIAAFGDEVRMGGGYGGSPAPGCDELGGPFDGNSLQRATPEVPDADPAAVSPSG